MSKTALRTLVVLALALGAIFLVWRSARPRARTIRLATGQKGGTFLPLGETLAKGFQKDVPKLTVEVTESPGGEASLDRLDAKEVDLALLSNHVPGRSSVKLVAPLYEETLQIVVRSAAGIATPFDLRGRAVSVGPKGSGTETIATTILRHFGLGVDGPKLQNLSALDAAEALEAGRLDAAFIVAGLRTPAVDRLLARKDMALLSLGDPSKQGSALEGISLDAPFFEVSTIPEHAYGAQPTAPVGTIRVRALLVARADLEEGLVRDLTESLFAHKVALSTEQRLLSHLSEKFDPGVSPYPLHPGADNYLRRADPTVVEKYTDQISLALTLAAIAWSGFAALGAWRKNRQRNRVEVWLEKGRTIALGAKEATDEAELRAVREALEEAREEAIREIEAERLEANEAFIVLHDYLTARIAELDRALERGARRA